MGRKFKFDCQAGQDNEFGFVRFFERAASAKFHNVTGAQTMFVFDRSALAVLVPLALLVAVVLFSNRSAEPATRSQANTAVSGEDQTVAANLPSR
jgi:hypothetical protein